MELTDLVKAAISIKHGWAVADQFEDTFGRSGEEEFEDQNRNALKYIQQTIEELLEAELLEPHAEMEMEEYLEELSEYLDK